MLVRSVPSHILLRCSEEGYSNLGWKLAVLQTRRLSRLVDKHSEATNDGGNYILHTNKTNKLPAERGEQRKRFGYLLFSKTNCSLLRVNAMKGHTESLCFAIS
jgi:hypothetical protein